MRVTLRAASLCSVPLLSILTLSQSVGVLAQPPSESRFFQMALLSYPYNEGGIHWVHTAAHEDISTFTSDNTNLQPPGRSIMLHEQWRGETEVDLSELDVDWSRILAVKIDEPYVTGLDDAGYDADEIRDQLPCGGPQWNYERQQVVAGLRSELLATASEVNGISPKTRVWVNFHEYEVNWIQSTAGCAQSLHLNDSSFDVVSFDIYHVDFGYLDNKYDWFVEHWPQQQLALVPATAYRNDETPAAAANRLQGFFDYANAMNQQCGMGLGRVGYTGNYDGCRVWLVAGWMSVLDFPHHGGWHGLLWNGSSQFASAAPILNAWDAQLSKHRRTGQRNLFAPEINAVIQTLR